MCDQLLYVVKQVLKPLPGSSSATVLGMRVCIPPHVRLFAFVRPTARLGLALDSLCEGLCLPAGRQSAPTQWQNREAVRTLRQVCQD